MWLFAVAVHATTVLPGCDAGMALETALEAADVGVTQVRGNLRLWAAAFQQTGLGALQALTSVGLDFKGVGVPTATTLVGLTIFDFGDSLSVGG